MDRFNDTLRDAIALIGGGIAEADAQDPELSKAVDAVIRDLRAADFETVIATFMGITFRLVDALAAREGQEPAEYWNHTAARLSARLAELENQA